MEISNKQKVVDLLKSIETGAPSPMGSINLGKYIHHNLAALRKNKSMNKTGKTIALTLVAFLSLVTFTFAQKTKYKTEQLNVNNFHLVDFVGWNTNLEVLANYHTKDVKVYGDGWMTSDMHQHDEALKGMLASPQTNVKVEQHSPNVALGEWTGVVGISVSHNMKIATIAKWDKGRIAEEYLFMVQLPKDSAIIINPSAKAIINFKSPNDEVLAKTVDIQPGWSCAMEIINGKRTAIFIKKENGKEIERLVFQ